MVTVAMQCPKCQNAFDVPAELVGEGHRCYACGLPIEPVRGAKGSHRQGHRELGGGRLQPIAAGAAVGAAVTVAFGLVGGPIGSAVIGGVCGAVLGFFMLALLALHLLEDVELLLDGTRITILAKAMMALGALIGACGGNFVSGAEDPTVVLIIGAVGGLIGGGLIGDRLARRGSR